MNKYSERIKSELYYDKVMWKFDDKGDRKDISQKFELSVQLWVRKENFGAILV